MTKRNYNINNRTNKKQKLDDDIEALWGEDLDESALDDCIKLATQVLEGEKVHNNSLNISKIPSYNVFKEPERLYSSTQMHSTLYEPSTSKDPPHSNKDNVNKEVHNELKELRLRYQEKEGEVSILRTQLKETRVNFSSEQQKSLNEWKKKFIISEKQIQSVKSELEFKSLEIANLKQKLIEVTKKNINISLNDNNDRKKNIKLDMERSVSSLPIDSRIHTIIDTDYPLRNVDSGVIITLPKKEKYIMETKQIQSFRKAIPYLQNQHVSSRHFVSKNRIHFENTLIAILKLINSSVKELNSNEIISTVEEVVFTCFYSLEDLHDFLQEIKLNTRTEDILELDSHYIKDNFGDTLISNIVNEIGVVSGIILDFISELLLNCDYLKNFLSSDNISFKTSNNGHSVHVTGHQFLKHILNILKLSSEIRKANLMSIFLNSSIKLCLNICKSKIYNLVSNMFCDIIKELIFLRPQISVVLQLTYLFKEASVHSSFIEFLFNKGKSCSSIKRGVVYFNYDACRFYIFVLMFEKCLFHVQNLPLDVCLNILCFIYNTYKTSYWVHHKNAKDCECLTNLYKIEIEIVHKALQKYVELKKSTQQSSPWDYFFKSKIVSNVLSLMMYHSYDLTEKDIKVFCQYKEIEQLLGEDENVNNLEKLNISEESQEISSRSFEKVDF